MNANQIQHTPKVTFAEYKHDYPYTLYQFVIDPQTYYIYGSLIECNIGNHPSSCPDKWIITGKLIDSEQCNRNLPFIITTTTTTTSKSKFKSTTIPQELKFVLDTSIQHYAWMDVELCDAEYGPILSIGMMHASYHGYKRHFHSYRQITCFRKIEEYTVDGLNFWKKKSVNSAHQILYAEGLKSEHAKSFCSANEMIHRFYRYKELLEFTIPNITFLYDDPHADYVMVNQALNNYRDELQPEFRMKSLRVNLADPKRYRQWKCSRDIKRSMFRILYHLIPHSNDKKFESFEEKDMDRYIRETWQQYFHLKRVNKDECSLSPPETTTATTTNTLLTKSRTIATMKSEFDIKEFENGMEHLPKIDCWKGFHLFFDLEDLRRLLTNVDK